MSNPTGDDVRPTTTGGAAGPGAFREMPVVAGPSPWVMAPGPVDQPFLIETEVAGARRRSIMAAALVALVVAGAGFGIGLLWLQVAPRIAIIKVAEGFVYAEHEPEQAIAADGVFGFLGLGAGAVVAILAWVLVRRYRGAAVLIGLVVGSLAGAWLAWWLGMRMGMAQFEAVRDTAPIGARLDAPLALRLTDLDPHLYWPPRLTGVVAAQALMAAATYTVLAGFSIHPGLRPPRRRPDGPAELSSGPVVPAGPTG